MKARLPLPLDVRLMNATAAVLLLVFAGLLLAYLLGWAARHPAFAIQRLSVQGDVAHSNEVTVRANVMPQLVGSLFTLDLGRVRGAFEALPWVRRAVVRREFPNRLKVQLQEHRAVAYWGAEDESLLMNNHGEVFEANVGEVELDILPRLNGPLAKAPQILAMYRELAPVLETLEFTLEQLDLSPRGSWRVGLDSGAVIELGTGDAAELRARLERFVHTLTQVTGRYGRRTDSLVSADLRYAQGYALRLQGVSTTESGKSR